MPGPKGEERGSALWWIIGILTCGYGHIYWMWKVGNEMKEFMGNDEINPIMFVVIQLFAPGVGLAWFSYKMGGWLMQARQNLGLPAEDKSTKYAMFSFILFLSVKMIQDDLNELWQQAGGAAPAA